MTVESEVRQKGSWWIFWPVFVAGLLGQLLASVLGRRMPFHFANGIAAFLTWIFVGLIFVRRWPPKYGIPAWLAPILIGLAAGLAAGVLAYLFPWR
jgi:uncharacterized membrane protein YjjP (DUF1212 family)